MSAYRYEPGDRVDYTFFPGDGGQGTPGTVYCQSTRNGVPYYKVDWDDGFRESESEVNANWWPEDELVREEP